MPNRKILLVEDNDDTRAMIRVLLEVSGCEVVEAEDGEVAVQLAKETRPQLILMDLNMPKLDGFDATRQIREIEGMKEVPIIVLSAYVFNNELKQQAIEEGATEVLLKPNDIYRLKHIINRYLSTK